MYIGRPLEYYDFVDRRIASFDVLLFFGSNCSTITQFDQLIKAVVRFL